MSERNPRKLDVPTKRKLMWAFGRFGTQNAVAVHFGVSHMTVAKWVRERGMIFTSHPEVLRANRMHDLMKNERDRVRVAQWIIDEGSVSSVYDADNDNTYLVVIGAMTDRVALEAVTRILQTTVSNGAVSLKNSWLPTGYVKVMTSDAYSLLKAIRNELVGLKHDEAIAALQFFPPSGYLKGRHTTDEFLIGAWKEFADGSLQEWNRKRKTPFSSTQIQKHAEYWLSQRTKKARMHLPKTSTSQNSRGL